MPFQSRCTGDGPRAKYSEHGSVDQMGASIEVAVEIPVHAAKLPTT